jgi:hypothetical protein
MPRFFFDVRDGVETLDREGTELAGIDEARVEAAKMAGTLLADNAAAFWTGEEWQISVRDQSGLVLFCLIFIGLDAPAAPPAKGG